jgi:3,4-dihydroxy 2-butanone 4-phosphate synthase / GTP cyclohydrolase II
MLAYLDNVEKALAELKQGRMIILTDNPDREDEGDMIMPAETITDQSMNFMIRYGSGIVCLSLTKDRLDSLQLPQMVPLQNNNSVRGTPFTISIDAKDGITTGVSAADRVQTIKAAIADDAKPNDLVKPGHIFPLQAQAGGVLVRDGHTEGAIDLVTLAGFKPAAVLCEIMNDDGTMTRGELLHRFASEHQLHTLSIADLMAYRLYHENLIEEEIGIDIPIKDYGTFKMLVIREKHNNHEHIVLMNTNYDANKPVLVRIHSACLTGDLFGSKRCDCGQQLDYALARLSKEGGIIIYLNQEGRGIGFFNKIKAYALQEKGLDTVEANAQLGLAIDARKYYVAAHLLRKYQIHNIRLLTNNPAKITELKKTGIEAVEREAMPIFVTDYNRHYLKTKKEKLNHIIPGDIFTDIGSKHE